MVLFRLFQRGFNGMLSGAAFYIMILFTGGRNIHRIPLWRRFLCGAGCLRFAPAAVIFGALAAGFHRLIGAHTHIILGFAFQTADRLGRSLIFLGRSGFAGFGSKFGGGAVLHLLSKSRKKRLLRVSFFISII